MPLGLYFPAFTNLFFSGILTYRPTHTDPEVQSLAKEEEFMPVRIIRAIGIFLDIAGMAIFSIAAIHNQAIQNQYWIDARHGAVMLGGLSLVGLGSFIYQATTRPK